MIDLVWLRERTRLARCLLLAAVGVLGACTARGAVAVNPSPAPLATYVVRFGAEGDTAIANVRARLPVSDGMLLMYPEGAEEFAAGWSHFVTQLEARDTTGQPLQLEPAGRDQWRVSGARVVDLSYRVRLLHDRKPHKWQFGVKEVAYVRPDFVFSTGKALFITNLEMPAALVRIEPPPGGRVLASWSRLAGGENDFHISGAQELTEAMIIAGTPIVRSAQVGNTRVNIATTRRLAPSATVVEEHTRRFLPAAAAVFGATPPGTLLVLLGQDTGYVGGGAAFEGGLSLMFPQAPGAENRAFPARTEPVDSATRRLRAAWLDAWRTSAPQRCCPDRLVEKGIVRGRFY